MLSGTLAAFSPLSRKQTAVQGDRTLGAAELDGMVLVSSTLGPVILGLPVLNTIGIGGVYQIVALDGSTNVVTVVTPTGNVILDTDFASVFAVRTATGWLVLRGSEGTNATCVEVNSVDDFPAPVAGDINLVSDTRYTICGMIDIGTNRIVLAENTSLGGQIPNVDGITGSGATIVYANGLAGIGCSVMNLRLVTGTPATEVFDVSNITSLMFRVMNCLVTGGGIAGTFDAVTFTVLADVALVALANGFVFTGALPVFSASRMVLQSNLAGFIGFDFPATAVIGVAEISDSFFDMGVGTTGLRFDPAAVLTRGTFLTCTFQGAGAYTDPVPLSLKADPRVRFLANIGIPDSQKIGGVGFAVAIAASVVIPIAVIGTFVDIPGPYVLDPNSERFDMPVAGQLRYIGNAPDITMHISASVSLDATVGGIQEARIQLAHNGVAIPNTEMVTQVINNIPFNVSTFANLLLQPNDILTVQAANLTAATNLDTPSVRLVAAV